MAINHWLVKQEPETYSWQTFVQEGGSAWTGVRNFQARNNLRLMRKGDLVLFYHSGDAKEVVGIARVQKEAYPDPSATDGDWAAVDLVPIKVLLRPVSLQTIKSDELLKKMPMVRLSRISVTPMSREQFARLLTVANTKL